jgi:hypothetical protein
MGTLVESDIDQFIRGHKTKLQEEKVHLNQYTVCFYLLKYQVLKRLNVTTLCSDLFTHFSQQPMPLKKLEKLSMVNINNDIIGVYGPCIGKIFECLQNCL